MAAKELPKIRAGMGDVESPAIEAWSDDDYRRATSLGTILSADGKADRAGVPALEPAALRECYRTMLRIRTLAERTRARAQADGAEPAHDPTGCEAAIVGAVTALEPDDVVLPGPREAGASLWRGHPVAAFATGAAVARALAVLPPTPYRGTHLPHAAGIAWAMKMQAKAQGKGETATGGKVVLAYLDRETTSTEDFHAGLNFAGVFKLPAAFLCINPGAGGLAGARPPASVETVSETLAVKALAYGIAGVRVDGSDIFAVYAATRAAATRARAGGGATFIEAALAETGDPLDRLRTWLAGQNLLDAAAEATLRREVEAEVDTAIAKP